MGPARVVDLASPPPGHYIPPVLAIDSARVLFVGLGGLGCPTALELVRAGARRLVLVDPDVVALDNLHRQPLYSVSDIGRAKVAAAAERLASLRPDLDLILHERRFGADLLDGIDLVLEGSDDLATKFAVSDACVQAGIPCVVGGVAGWRGVVVVQAPDGPCYRCVFEAPPEAELPTCAQGGVLGPVAGWVGAVQAERALRLGDVEPVWTCDARAGVERAFSVDRDPGCASCGGWRTLDVTGELCPMTYVRTKLALEEMAAGERLLVWLRPGEAAHNVPRSVREDGHRILSLRPTEGRVRLLIEK